MGNTANRKGIQTLESLTYIDSAEGMARRVLNDFRRSGLSKKDLALAYLNGLGLSDIKYPNLIRLGNLLQELGTLSKSIPR